jgi:threonine dehydratase
VIAQVSGADPFSLFTSIGVGGLIAGVTYLWQRDTAKQRDRALDVVSTLTSGMLEIRQAIDKSNEAHLASSTAMREMTSALKSMPNAETWYRLSMTIDRLDREQPPPQGKGGAWMSRPERER